MRRMAHGPRGQGVSETTCGAAQWDRRAEIRKVVTGGQTGVDRAALDAALAAGIAIGGWCPRGRRAEDGRIAERYPLRETPSRDYRERTRWNVRDSDGTLILTLGNPSGGTALTWRTAVRLKRPVFVADLAENLEHLARRIDRWAAGLRLRTLNIAGPRASQQPAASGRTTAVLSLWWDVENLMKSEAASQQASCEMSGGVAGFP